MEKILKILLDLDGCVTAPSGNTDSSVTSGLQGIREIIAQAGEIGLPNFVACTGREGRWAAAILYSLGATKGWSVVESGLFLLNMATGETKRHPALTPEIMQLFQEGVSPIVRQICKERPEIILYKGNEISAALEIQGNARLTIPELYDVVSNALQALLAGGHIKIHASDIAVDITPGIDKGNGIAFLSAITGVDPANMLFIGDTGGDIPALEKVGYTGCPGNSTPECKAFVRSRRGHVSDSGYSAGVLGTIKHYKHLMF